MNFMANGLRGSQIDQLYDQWQQQPQQQSSMRMPPSTFGPQIDPLLSMDNELFDDQFTQHGGASMATLGLQEETFNNEYNSLLRPLSQLAHKYIA